MLHLRLGRVIATKWQTAFRHLLLFAAREEARVGLHKRNAGEEERRDAALIRRNGRDRSGGG